MRAGWLGILPGMVAGLWLIDRYLYLSGRVGRSGCMNGLAALGHLHWILGGIVLGGVVGSVAASAAAGWYWSRADRKTRRRARRRRAVWR
jgi:hypothetical protein